MTLADLQPDDVAIIEEVQNGEMSGKAMRRFREMGLMKGAEIKLVRRAPLNDPIEISVLGALFSIRGENAKHILVSKKEA
ncbi:ferrous iron transport protein A [Verrucomicrobiales bacterium]|nr:ferrous iron transport protein A [bacterium]MDB4662698.1 ferrous iron transport protein A [Verrucomicrobiales bacterium]MDC0258808.1 ferrous iron transport protein A [Verrucomicrobiales bacterium]MDC0322102.1 ferrous iron transport protein A [Verrucomicrobiales bacterium]